jgi:hypothetical protein
MVSVGCVTGRLRSKAVGGGAVRCGASRRMLIPPQTARSPETSVSVRGGHDPDDRRALDNGIDWTATEFPARHINNQDPRRCVVLLLN